MVSRKEITQRLRIARAARNWSQAEVERRARRHFKTFPKGKYWRIENGYDDALPSEQRAIEKVLTTQIFTVEERRTA